MSCLHTKHRDTWHAALQDVHIPILILYFVYSFTEWSHHQSFASSCLLNFLGKIRRLLSIAGWDVKNPLRGTYYFNWHRCRNRIKLDNYIPQEQLTYHFHALNFWYFFISQLEVLEFPTVVRLENFQALQFFSAVACIILIHLQRLLMRSL